MKRIIFAFIFVLLVSCGVEELYESNQVEHITYKEISDMELLSRWGYDTTDVKTFDEYYLLYDEIVFYKADLKPHKTVPVTKLYTYQQRLPLEGQHLRLGFYSPIEASNKQYLNDAIYQWNGLEDCNILFATSDDSGQSSLWPEVPIEISDNPWLETSGMLTISPLVGNSGDFPRVLVNTSHSLWKKLPDNQKTYAIMHALGHLVGLLDSDDDNRYGYVPYSNNGEDMFSIMKPVYRITNEWVNNYWSGFSAYDKDDIPLLFPLKPESVDFSVTPAVPNNSLFEDTDYTISVNTVSLKEMTNISYQLRVDYIDSNTYDFTMSSEEPKFNINLKHPGECKMTVTLLGNRDWRNDKTRAIAEKEFHVAENTLSFPENITLGEDCLFEWQYNNPNYPNARIRFSASESYFDNGSGKNVTIDYISNHSANIRFNDYGNYTITAEILNDQQMRLSNMFISENYTDRK